MDFSRRIEASEHMDSPSTPKHLMVNALRFLEFTNKYFGGEQTIMKYLNRWSKSWEKNKPIKILDIGTGSADIPRSIVGWARKNGFHVHITGIDLIRDIVEIALEKSKTFPEISIKQENFFSLAAQGERFDYVISSLLLHHLGSDQLLPGLKLMNQLATRGIILSDLNRSRMGYLMVGLLSHILGNAIVRHDGPISIRRALKISELMKMSEHAGLAYTTTRPERWFRLSLSGEKIHAA